MRKKLFFLANLIVLMSAASQAGSVKISNLSTGDSLTANIVSGMTVGIQYSTGDSIKIEWGRPVLSNWEVSERGRGYGGGNFWAPVYSKATDFSSISIDGAIRIGNISVNGTATSTTSYSLNPTGSEIAYPDIYSFPTWTSGLQAPAYSFLFVAQQNLPYQLRLDSTSYAESAKSYQQGYTYLAPSDPLYSYPPDSSGWGTPEFARVWTSNQSFYSGTETFGFTLIPEPSSCSLVLVGGMILLTSRKTLKNKI